MPSKKKNTSKRRAEVKKKETKRVQSTSDRMVLCCGSGIFYWLRFIFCAVLKSIYRYAPVTVNMSNISFGRVYAVYLQRMRWPVYDCVGKCSMLCVCERFFRVVASITQLTLNSIAYLRFTLLHIDAISCSAGLLWHKENNPFLLLKFRFYLVLHPIFFYLLESINTEFDTRAWTFRKSILLDIDFESGNCIWFAFPRTLQITFAIHCSQQFCLPMVERSDSFRGNRLWHN